MAQNLPSALSLGVSIKTHVKSSISAGEQLNFIFSVTGSTTMHRTILQYCRHPDCKTGANSTGLQRGFVKHEANPDYHWCKPPCSACQEHGIVHDIEAQPKKVMCRHQLCKVEFPHPSNRCRHEKDTPHTCPSTCARCKLLKLKPRIKSSPGNKCQLMKDIH